MLINHKYHVAKIHIKLFICHIVGDATKKKKKAKSSDPAHTFFIP